MESIAQLLERFIPGYSAVPEAVRDLIPVMVSCVVIFACLALAVLFAVWLERKVSAHIQDRLGPMYVGGWHGWAQTLADALKLLLKEDIVPASADKILFKTAPFVVFLGAFAAFVVIPFGASSFVTDLNIGLLYVFAVGSLSVIGIIMAGWASNNKYSLYGGMRAAAQIISYEIPSAISIMTVVIPVGSLSLVEIVSAQQGGVQNWFILRYPPFVFLGFIIYFIASLAEVNRTPFDIPEAESELVAGYHTEYSGMRFAFFFLAEYANMFLVASVATALFLGGWTWFFPTSMVPQFIPGPVLFFGKVLVLIFVQMWLRWSLPRLRVDQLMYLNWKVLLPGSLVLVLGVGWAAVYW